MADNNCRRLLSNFRQESSNIAWSVLTIGVERNDMRETMIGRPTPCCANRCAFASILRKSYSLDRKVIERSRTAVGAAIVNHQHLSLIHISEPTRRTPISY